MMKVIDSIFSPDSFDYVGGQKGSVTKILHFVVGVAKIWTKWSSKQVGVPDKFGYLYNHK